MKIPKRVNAALDWAESHGRVTAAAVLLLIVALGTLWEPALAALALGLAVGGLVVYQRLSKRIERLRREIDDLLRDNGRLRHRATVLASGVVKAEALETQQLMAIPDVPGALDTLEGVEVKDPLDVQATKETQATKQPEPTEHAQDVLEPAESPGQTVELAKVTDELPDEVIQDVEEGRPAEHAETAPQGKVALHDSEDTDAPQDARTSYERRKSA